MRRGSNNHVRAKIPASTPEDGMRHLAPLGSAALLLARLPRSCDCNSGNLQRYSQTGPVARGVWRAATRQISRPTSRLRLSATHFQRRDALSPTRLSSAWQRCRTSVAEFSASETLRDWARAKKNITAAPHGASPWKACRRLLQRADEAVDDACTLSFRCPDACSRTLCFLGGPCLLLGRARKATAAFVLPPPPLRRSRRSLLCPKARWHVRLRIHATWVIHCQKDRPIRMRGVHRIGLSQKPRTGGLRPKLLQP